MATDFRLIANKGVRELKPYVPGTPIEQLQREYGISSPVKLASNENPLGPSPKVIEAVQDVIKNAHIYPDGAGFEIKESIANYLSVDTDQLTIGNGSENILELIAKSYLQKGDSVVISEYAFLTIPIILQSYDANIKVVPAKNWGHDLEAMIEAVDKNTRMIFVVNPNNPTGTYTNKNDFQKLLKAVPDNVLIVVDEAYSEFIDAPDYPEALSYLHHYPNLIITRTFSKAYGLAALRLGYSISSSAIADILNRARLPFNVNSVAAKAGCVALKDQAHVAASLLLNERGMQQFEVAFNEMHLEFIPSVCNFVTVDVGNGMECYQKLLRLGVIVRPLTAYNMPRHIRVTIGTEEQNNIFLNALQNITEKTGHTT